MKAIFLTLILVCSVAAQAQEVKAARKSGRDALTFKNGDVLFGSLSSIDSTNGISWTRPDALNLFRFRPDRISQVDLAAAAIPPEKVSSNLCSVQLNNGDQFQGELVSYDGQKLKLDTWFGGALEFPRESIALVAPLGLPKPTIFSGPTGLEGWTIGKVNAAGLVEAGEWLYQNNAFYAFKSASIARDLNLPESASMQFDLEWRGFFHIAVALYTEYLHPVNLPNKETEPKFGGFYSMQINPFSANLLPVKQTEPLRYLGQASLQTLAQKNSAHFDIRVNKAKKILALLIDGVLVKQWVDTDDFAGTGTGVRFVHQGQGAVKLTNLKISEWDGLFEEPVTITANKSQDLARLKNGDRVFGSVKGMRDGKLSIEAAGTTLDVPLIRVKQVEIATGKAPAQTLNTNTVRAFFASGSGSLTFDLQSWTASGLSAESSNFGAANFKSNAFSRLVFDLNTEPLPP
jgi:hypothetical protein